VCSTGAEPTGSANRASGAQSPVIYFAVVRAPAGTVDHTSVLTTMEELWDLEPLTERDKAEPSWSDVLMLAQPRTDDLLSELAIPSSGVINPN
jgi:hypothetical protein